ncbi:MAG: hypothetical protein C4528_01315 [Gammaproteobacteria bacterium]|nr:MAG: hypothetical protein C4528_01315 [Gammaproteobacteria bacterium]
MCAEHRPPARASRQAGVTLVELIVFIVIVGIAVAGILMVMTTTTQRSADPMIRQQAQLIAESYLEEVLLKPVLDPSSGTNRICPAPETSRGAYDNVCDYYNLTNTGAIDQLGNPISGLDRYSVSVTVVPSPANPTAPVSLHTLSNDYVNNLIRVMRVEVAVTPEDSPSLTVRLAGYRTNYNCNATGNAGCLALLP